MQPLILLALYPWLNPSYHNIADRRTHQTSLSFPMVLQSPWPPQLSSTLLSPKDSFLGVDGLSLVFVLLTTLLTPMCLLASWLNGKGGVQGFFLTLLVIESLLGSLGHTVLALRRQGEHTAQSEAVYLSSDIEALL
jgi:hypothetical protein